MNPFTRFCDRLAKEPVAVNTAVIAGLQLAAAIRTHHVYEGAVTACVLALVGLFTRAQVTPTAAVDVSEEAF